MNTKVENTLKGWEVSLNRYGHIDNWSFNEKINCIGEYLKSAEDSLIIRRLVSKIRDLVILQSDNVILIQNLIQSVLSRIECLKEAEICRSSGRATPGQRCRFKEQTYKLFDEKLRFMGGKMLRNFDVETETARDSKKVRRIVEKRMSQAYYKMNCKATSRCNNSRSHRYWMQRATAFQLYNIGQIEHVKNVSRGLSTHWKRMYDPITGETVFKKKMAYSSYDEAMEAIDLWYKNRPEDMGMMGAYKCSICKKWHIGHNSTFADGESTESISLYTNYCGCVC